MSFFYISGLRQTYLLAQKNWFRNRMSRTIGFVTQDKSHKCSLSVS